MTVKLRVGSSPVGSAGPRLPQDARGAFVIRPRRAVRRGDVLTVIVSGRYVNGGRARFGGRWRLRVQTL